MFATVGRVVESYISRGDPVVEVPDYTVASFTKDGAWHDLNLSALVPAGAKIIRVSGSVTDDAVGSLLWLRKKGSASSYTGSTVRTNVANLAADYQFALECDENRVIQYLASNVTWVTIYLTVLGWWK